MNPKHAGFAPVPDAIAKMAAAAPGGSPAPAPTPAPTTPAAALETVKASFQLPVREAMQSMNVKVPKTIYDDLRNFMKLTDIPMSEVIVEGARKELALLKKKHGLE